ncbi:hypothetical protein FBY03_11930 [Pseudomonas sp. SJZ079]|nr:hypothetical protein FBY03_11930 [Pseudomonas sp. SJZ079]
MVEHYQVVGVCLLGQSLFLAEFVSFIKLPMVASYFGMETF